MITIRYKCSCMLEEGSFVVRYRRSDEDVVDWMEDALNDALSRDHRRRSPLCMATKTEYAIIPAPENATGGIGTKPVTN